MDKIYLVRYCGGNWEDYYSAVVFATTKRSKAIKYVRKFNFLLKIFFKSIGKNRKIEKRMKTMKTTWLG